jgi:DNA-binding MarR family transcriptional regulator
MPSIRPAKRSKIRDGDTAPRHQGQHSLRILNAIRQIIRAADLDSRKLAAEHQITAPQLLCLMAIVELGTTTATDIAQRIHVSESTLVGVLERLEDKKLIERARGQDDRRVLHLTATSEARDLVASTPFPLQYSLDRALNQMSEKERHHTAACVERLVDLMGAGEIQPAPMLEILAVSQRQKGGEKKP